MGAGTATAIILPKMAILFLNGCTSAGKTSIARALQRLLDPPHLRLGIDDGFAMLPPQLHNHPDGFYFDTDDRGEVRLNHGAFGLAMLKAHARCAAAIAASDIDLILDEVVLEPDLRADWAAVLGPFAVFRAGIHCALGELERREIARGDRLIGQARGQLDLVHRDMAYDFEIDTTAVPPATAAAAIAGAYRNWRQRC